ncbi:MAG: YiaA/YiaB family inner membrane protein [Geitlerinemataceae cyanobacterium]
MKNQHSAAWIFQAWASFVISISVLGVGIVYMPVDPWKKAFLGMGVLFSIASTFSVAKTTRDLHEAKRFTSRVDEARVEKLIGEHDKASSMV